MFENGVTLYYFNDMCLQCEKQISRHKSECGNGPSAYIRLYQKKFPLFYIFLYFVLSDHLADRFFLLEAPFA